MSEAVRKVGVPVSALTRRIQETLTKAFSSVSVCGRIAKFTRASAGNWFFHLKDGDTLIHAVMFQSRNRQVGFAPVDGMDVIVRGRVEVHAVRGGYQLIVETMDQNSTGESP